MSDVITTKRIDGYRLAVVLNHTRGHYHIYDLLLHTPNNDEPVLIAQSIFDHAQNRAQLAGYAIGDIKELQETLTALINALPDAESVRNGVHEL
jgi:hypothetical protein